MPKASRLTDRIAETTLWKGNIPLAGAKKSGTLISYNGMATSLRILVEQPGYFQSVGDEEQQCHILNAYWEGIKMVLPDTMRNPERYNLQRTLGATALHNVLVNVLAVMVSKGFSVLEPAKYAEIMESSLTQLGETNAEVLGGYELLTQTGRAVQLARLCAITWPARRRWRRSGPRGDGSSPTPYLRCSDGILDLGVAAMVGIPVPGFPRPGR